MKMITKIKINTHFSLWGAISIYQSECCGVCVKHKLQKQEIVRKIEFRIETRRAVKVERKRQLPAKKKNALRGAEQMKWWPKRKMHKKMRFEECGGFWCRSTRRNAEVPLAAVSKAPASAQGHQPWFQAVAFSCFRGDMLIFLFNRKHTDTDKTQTYCGKTLCARVLQQGAFLPKRKMHLCLWSLNRCK